MERAQAISTVAYELGLTAEPSALQTFGLVIDDLTLPSISAFWRAVLGTSARAVTSWIRCGGCRQCHSNRRIRPGGRATGFTSTSQARTCRPCKEQNPCGRSVGSDAGINDYTIADAEGNEADIIPADGLGEEAETADWRVLFSGATFYPTSPALAAELATVVAGLVDDAGMPMQIDLRPEGLVIDTVRTGGRTSDSRSRPPDPGRGPRYGAFS